MRARLIRWAIAMVTVLVGCGGDKPTTPNVTVNVAPSTATVRTSATQRFTAVVTGTEDQGVVWTVDGGEANGTVTQGGLYTAPASVPSPPTATVRATSSADHAKSGTAAVTITPAPVTLTVDPAEATVEVGATQQFTATVTGTANTAVTWSVDGGAANGSIDPSGLYMAPATVPDPARVTVTATSVADASASGAAEVTIVVAGLEGFVLVPAGSFTMGDGSSDSYCGSTQYPVTLTEDFYLGQTEVTNQQYLELVQWAYDRGYVTATSAAVMDAMGSTAELLVLDGQGCEIAFADGAFSLRNAGYGINPDHPVKQVTWNGAAAYCDWLSLKEGLAPAYDHSTWRCNDNDPYRAQGYRLPTDAEWEYAAQYDDERIFPWGNEAPTCDRTDIAGCNNGWTDPVASYPAEKSFGGNGLYDMAGNVMEWCNDWHRCAAAPSSTDPPGPLTGTYRVLRGGLWGDSSPFVHERCAFRYYYDPVPHGGFLHLVGFRVARSGDAGAL
jgi:formylglycine-generating enzyme required for sulfatase activity